MDPLHCVTAVTGDTNAVVVVVQAACGSPAAPWHSMIVTDADPPLGVIVLTMVTSQMSPRPPVLSTPLLHVVVAAAVPALTPVASTRELKTSRAPATMAKGRFISSTCLT